MKNKSSISLKKMESSIHYTNWIVGAHTRFCKKICDTLWTSVNYGMHTTQFFMGSQRSFNRSRISEQDILESKKILKRWPMHVFSHFPYTANFAGSVKQLAWDGDDEQDSKTSFVVDQLQYESNILGNFGLSNGVVIHPGSNPNRKEGLSAVAKSLNRIQFNENSKVILENCAGEGHKFPSTLEEIKEILDQISDENQSHIGVCIDTCHLFAVGDYDLCKKDEIDRLFDDFERIIGMDKFTLLHLNDSQTERGSRVDRHACLGTGHIWSDSFDSLIHLMNKCKENRIPAVLETHGLDMLTLARLDKEFNSTLH